MSLTPDDLEDMKQLMTAVVRQETTGLATGLEKLETKVDGLQQQVNGLQQQITDLDDKVDTIAEALHEDLADHERRITKLEQQPA